MQACDRAQPRTSHACYLFPSKSFKMNKYINDRVNQHHTQIFATASHFL